LGGDWPRRARVTVDLYTPRMRPAFALELVGLTARTRTVSLALVLSCLAAAQCSTGGASSTASSGISSSRQTSGADTSASGGSGGDASALSDAGGAASGDVASQEMGGGPDSGGSDAASDVGTGSGSLIEASSGDSAGPAGDGGSSARDFSTDRTQFFGASRCAQAGVQLCEDFESGILDKTTWSVQGTPPVIDGQEHARGSRALHITQPGNGLSYIKETKTFPEMNDTYWGRIFVFFKSLPAAPLTYAHWTFIAASGTGVSGEIRVSGQLQNGGNLFGVGTDNRVDDAGTGDWTSSDDDPPKAPVAVPLNQWICIEWLHKGDTNETRFYWDGVEHPSLSTSATVHGGNSNPFLLPQFTNVWIGWQEYQTTTESFELWIDEIAIDSARIGCVL
jgi:hypothetical protein